MRTPSKDKKLLKGEPVEVRQREDGLRGAWHEGLVIESTSLQRRVKYKHLLDDNGKDVLVESVRVSHVVEGWKAVESDRSKEKRRGYIRPLPPPLNMEVTWNYGLCVDALYDDAWWEGVILDNLENSSKRSVFFPDEGDEIMIPKKNLRVTQDWDETGGRWGVRGHWKLAQLLDVYGSPGFSIKVVWYNLRTHSQFVSKVGEWVKGKTSDWSECLNEGLQLIEREPSRQLIPGLNAPGTQNYLNREESILSGSRGRKNSSQFQMSNNSHESNLDEDRNHGAIVCCETESQVWPLDAVVGHDTPTVLSENANNLIERIGHGFRNSRKSSSKENCFDKELSKALWRSSDADTRRRSKESLKAIDADVDERESAAHRKPCNCEVNGMEQIHCLDRALMKDVVNMSNTKQQTRHIDKELYRDVVMGASLKHGAKSKQNQSFKFPPSEANSKGQMECIDNILLKTSIRDQFNSKQSSKLSQQISGKCKSLTLEVRGKELRKLNAGHQPTSTSTSKPSEDCLAAVLSYNPISNSSKEIMAKAKTYLFHQGWRLEVKCRTSSERQDMHYVSPNGNIYYSLYQACLAWKEQQKVERMIDGHCEDVWGKSSASPSSQEPPVRVKQNMLSSITKIPNRLWRTGTSQLLCRKDSNNDEIHGASKINRSRKLGSRSKRLQGDGNKNRSVICDGPSVSELTHGTQPCNFLSNSVVRDFDLRNSRAEESNSKVSRQAAVPGYGWSFKKRKFNSEGSMDVQKRNEAKSSCYVGKTKGTPPHWYQMPDLPSTPRRVTDSSSCHDKPSDINLPWLIENGVVDENQQVFFMYGKEGWIKREGILCACCYRVHSLTSFEAHAGSKLHQFSVNLRLDDGRSLAQCQMQALRKTLRASSEAKRTRAPLKENKKQAPLSKVRMIDSSQKHDDFCFVCRQAGVVTLCDRCTRSFHADCVHPEKIPGTEECSKWFCPNCRCDKCGGGDFSDDTVLFCDQCECVFHAGCLDGMGMPKLASCPQGKWFCNTKCSEIFSELRNLVGKVNPVGNEGLSWTLLRSTEEDRDPSCDEIIEKMAKKKLSAALSVMRRCFLPISEERIKKDYMEEMIFNRGCERNILKFQGFYTAILEKGNKLISVATVRVHGKRGAEMPFIATRKKYRRKGMCRLLLNELEKILFSMQIEKIVLPATCDPNSPWENSFGFRKMTAEETFELLKLDIVHFAETIMLQKILMRANPVQETEINDSKNRAEGMHCSLGSTYGLEIQEGSLPGSPEINECQIRSYTEVVESVTPLCTLPFKTITLRKRCRNDTNKIKKIEYHSGKSPMEDDVDESSVVIMGVTRSNRVVKQVKRKIGYSCRWEEPKPMRSVEHYLRDRKIYKRRKEDKIIASDKFCAVPPHDSLEASQKKDVQFGTCEIGRRDDGKSIICRKNSGIADGNCFSEVKYDEPKLDRPVLEHGSDGVAINRENVSGNSHTVNCNENDSENCCGHLAGQDSFKYFYMRRKKRKCSENAFSGD